MSPYRSTSHSAIGGGACRRRLTLRHTCWCPAQLEVEGARQCHVAAICYGRHNKSALSPHVLVSIEEPGGDLHTQPDKCTLHNRLCPCSITSRTPAMLCAYKVAYVKTERPQHALLPFSLSLSHKHENTHTQTHTYTHTHTHTHTNTSVYVHGAPAYFPFSVWPCMCSTARIRMGYQVRPTWRMTMSSAASLHE
jgi:hypothetical protein